MKKISILAMLGVSALVAYPATPNLLSVTNLAVLPRYSLVTVGSIAELKALSMTVLSTTSNRESGNGSDCAGAISNATSTPARVALRCALAIISGDASIP